MVNESPRSKHSRGDQNIAAAAKQAADPIPVQIADRFDCACLTLSSDRAAVAAIILRAKVVIPLHFAGWRHSSQGADQLRAAFHRNGVADRLRLPERGETVAV
jgi:hypothetical protein